MEILQKKDIYCCKYCRKFCSESLDELFQHKFSHFWNPDEEISPEKEQALLKTIEDRYKTQTSAYYAAARLWVDAIIDPLETRHWISSGIEAANNCPIDPFNVGVLQV